MRLIKLLIAVVAIHLGLGFAQVGANYFGGDVADYGDMSIVSYTPLERFLDLNNESEQVSLSVFSQMLDWADRIGDTINGLVTFNYGIITSIGTDDGAVYGWAILVRVGTAILSLSLGIALIYFLFDSNILTSSLGLALVGLGLGTASALSATGALI